MIIEFQKILHKFVVRQLHDATANSKQFFETTNTGVVSLNSFCSCNRWLSQTEGATPLSFIGFNFLQMRQPVKNDNQGNNSTFFVAQTGSEMPVNSIHSDLLTYNLQLL